MQKTHRDRMYVLGIAPPEHYPVLETELIDGVYCVKEPDRAEGKEEE